jgi:hypothetical protein
LPLGGSSYASKCSGEPISNSECSRKRRNDQYIKDRAIEVARKIGETVSDELSTYNKIAEQAAF